MKKMYSLLLLVISLILVFSITVSADSRRPLYTDVDGDHWAYDAIQYAVRKQLFSGYSDGSFLPDKNITRAEAAKVLSCYIDLILYPVNRSSFVDVSCDAWYAQYVEAVKKFFPGGNEMSYFRPEEPMTREETVYILVNANKLNNKIQYLDVSLVDSYADSNIINNNLKMHLAIGVQTSLISGYSDGTIRPDKPLSRAEFATLLYRANQMRS